jgi:nitrogen-specific signal transduction histidine kinase/CheY-like chemotaxis protein
VRDVTEKKKLEAQFLRTQRLESIGTLAGGIAHDLNNVLAPILMGSELLQTHMPDAQRNELLQTIRVSAERGADLVKQVFLFARGVEGTRVPVEPSYLVKDLVKLLRSTLPKTIAVQTSFAPESWTIQGDATQLTQVLMNLCVNARDAMPRGGRLSINVANLFLDAATPCLHGEIKPGPYLLFQVADTGTGIPAEVVDKIFDPFFTTKEIGKGTGLGLSTVLGIVRSHDGAIDMTSTPGKGTRFSVYLPAVPNETAAPAAAPAPDLTGGRGELILVVDDEPSICQVTKSTLEAAGYRVLVAGDGNAAVAKYLEYRDRVRLVLADTMMPVMDGPAAIRALQKVDPSVRVIAVTGMRAAGKAGQKPGLGEKACLQKPYTAGKLLQTVRAVWDSCEPAPALCSV